MKAKSDKKGTGEEDMKNAMIYVFSGTGNTKRACDIYKSEFEKFDVETTLYIVKKALKICRIRTISTTWDLPTPYTDSTLRI